MNHRLAHCVGRSSQATPAAVDKSPRRLTHKNPDAPMASGARAGGLDATTRRRGPGSITDDLSPLHNPLADISIMR